MYSYAYEHAFASSFLNRAFYSANNIERLKWVTVFLLTRLHLSPLQTKPFNPIIGETLQLRVGDLDLYLEHIVSKPPTCLIYGLSKNYTIEGHLSTEAVTSANSCKAKTDGKFVIRFTDGQAYELFFPPILINGITLGKRLFMFRKTAVVLDKVYKLLKYRKTT